MESDALMAKLLKQGFQSFLGEAKHYGFSLKAIHGYFCECTATCERCGEVFTENVLVTPVLIHEDIRWSADLPLRCPDCREGAKHGESDIRVTKVQDETI